MKTTKNYKEFIKYFNSFHSINGLYPTTRNATDDEIIQAIGQIDDFHGDTIDREKVRDLVFSPKEIEDSYKSVSRGCW